MLILDSDEKIRVFIQVNEGVEIRVGGYWLHTLRCNGICARFQNYLVQVSAYCISFIMEIGFK